MGQSNQQQISELMDGELDRPALEFLLRRIGSDAELSGRWCRYHLVRACLHQELSSPFGLTERVASGLADEPVLSASITGRRWFRPVVGSAIAASAALFAIVAINSSVLERGQYGEEAAAPDFTAASSALDRPFSPEAVPVAFNEISAADRQRINALILRHNQVVNGGGFVPYLPIVTTVTESPDGRPLPESDEVSEQRP